MSDRFYANLRRELEAEGEARWQRDNAEAIRAARVIEAHQRAERAAAARAAAHRAITAVIDAGGTDDQAVAAGRKAMEEFK